MASYGDCRMLPELSSTVVSNISLSILAMASNGFTYRFIGIVLIIIFVVYSLSVGAAYPVIAAETSSLHLRAASQSIGFFSQFLFAWIFSFTIPYMYAADAGNLGGKVGFIFAVLSAIALAIVWFEIPEMKNRTFAELDEMFELKLPTRMFNNYTCVGILQSNTKAEEAGM